MTATGSLRAHRVRYLMGILSPECALPVPSAHFPPHYTALSMSVASYASICTHVTIAVTTTATVTFVSTFIVCTHYKGRNLLAHTEIPVLKKHSSIPRLRKQLFQLKACCTVVYTWTTVLSKIIPFFHRLWPTTAYYRGTSTGAQCNGDNTQQAVETLPRSYQLTAY